MASDLAQLKKRYDALCRVIDVQINRHPQLSLSSELEKLAAESKAQDIRDIYGAGGVIAEFESQLCDLLDKPSSIFLPTGTLAQCAALKCYAESSGRNVVGLHPTSHILLHEHMAIEHLWGLYVNKVGEKDRVLRPDDFTHLNPIELAAVIIELPMREIGGVLPTWEHLLAIRAWCDLHSIKMHMDGARLWQTGHFYQRSLSEITALFDSIYVSFYKDMGGIFGAALLGEKVFIEDAKIWARRAGGNPVTQYPEVLAARRGIANYLPKMPQYAKYTEQLARALGTLTVSLTPKVPQASMFHIQFDCSPLILTQRIVDYAQLHNVIPLPLPRPNPDGTCFCEISVGESTISHPPEFWLTHIQKVIHR